MSSTSSSLRPFERQHVDLDRGEARGLCGPEAVQNLIEAIIAGDLPETIRSQGIQTDIQALDTGRAQGTGILREQHGIRAQRQVFDAGQ